jgi:hypothetical protein
MVMVGSEKRKWVKTVVDVVIPWGCVGGWDALLAMLLGGCLLFLVAVFWVLGFAEYLLALSCMGLLLYESALVRVCSCTGLFCFFFLDGYGMGSLPHAFLVLSDRGDRCATQLELSPLFCGLWVFVFVIEKVGIQSQLH